MKNLLLSLSLLVFCLAPAFGQVSFSLDATLTPVGQPNCVYAADINGDGKIDILCTDYTTNFVSVYTNNGHAGFALLTNLVVGTNLTTGSNLVAGVKPFWVTAADVNGDNLTDIIVAVNGANQLSIFTNNGHGGFVLSSTPGTGSQPVLVIATNIMPGGLPALISANFTDSSLTILTNNGSGGYAFSSSNSVGTNPYQVVATDVNGDGYLDLVAACFNGNCLTILTNDHTGKFVLSTNLTGNVSNPTSVATADVNGDGKPDLISCNWNINQIAVFTNNGSGGFAVSGTYNVGYYPDHVEAADFNGDGKVDIVTTISYNGSGGNCLTILTNNGTGGFAVATSPAVGQTPFVVAIADFNGDGKPDLVDGNGVSVTLTILTNNTIFPVAPTIIAEPESQVVAAGTSASFGVLANGSPAPIYQWTLNGTNLPGATSNILTIPHADLTNSGSYQVVVQNAGGSTNSTVAMLDIEPYIATPFVGGTPVWGSNVLFSVYAKGSGTLSYQWYDNGAAIVGATNATLDFASIQFTNAGAYNVVVTSPYGSVTNATEQVVVNPGNLTLGFSPTLTITGSIGNTYTIQSSSNLASDNNWVTLTNLTLTSPVQIWVDTSVIASSPYVTKYFYKVVAQ